MITPTDYISDFAYGQYVRPALERGDKTVTIDSREVCDGLGGAYSENFVGTVLAARGGNGLFGDSEKSVV